MSVNHQPRFQAPQRAEVEACGDHALLLSWHAECYDVADMTRSQLDARLSSETAEEDWLIRASDMLSIVMTTARRIERRIAALGHDLPVTRDSAEQATIRRLKRLVKDLRDILRENNIDDETKGRH